MATARNDNDLYSRNVASKQMQNSQEITSVSEIVGGFGVWQRKIFIFFFIAAIFSAYHGLGLSFYAPDITFWCKRPHDLQNISLNDWISTVKNNETLQCKKIENPNEDCDRWEYDLSFYSSTIISEFDLTCKRAWLASMTQSCYMAGSMIAVVAFGQASDSLGRHPIIWFGFFIEVISALSCTFSVNIYQYMVSRFMLAIGQSARWGTGFVLILESSGPKYRSYLGVGIQFGWAVGYISLPLIAYILRDYRYIQFACFAPEVLLLLCWFWIPESPRWQLSNRQLTKAKSTIKRAAAINGKDTADIESKLTSLLEKCENEKEKEQKLSERKATLKDLWIKPNIRKKTLILYFTWFVNAFVYYGISLNTNSLGGDPFISFALAGLVEVPSYILTLFGLERFGRRMPLMWAMLGGGLGCLATIPFSMNDDYIWLRVTFAMIGKFCVTASYAMVYVYSAELYPTVARNVGVGSSSMVARIGSILAPFVKELSRYTHIGLVMAIFGIISVVDGFLVLLLPETKGKEIPDTIEEAENFGKEKKGDYLDIQSSSSID